MTHQDRNCGKLRFEIDLIIATTPELKFELRSTQYKSYLDTAWLDRIQSLGNTSPNPLLHLTTCTVRNPRFDMMSTQKVSIEVHWLNERKCLLSHLARGQVFPVAFRACNSCMQFSPASRLCSPSKQSPHDGNDNSKAYRGTSA
jgi:hypothetical protein